ncbi:MAG: CheY-like chemotaxis protein [Bacteriovoracaceae bacterium]|jgi:CheY-like chemotaxis protein
MQIEKEAGFIELCFKYIDTAKNCILDYRNGAQGIEKYTTIIDGINIQDKYTAGKMLLIEPSLSIVKIFQKVAEDNKLEITVLNNGATALNRIIHESYDLIVASAAIEVIDGESLLKGLKVMKNINQKTPMLLISADPYEQLENTDFDFILKDINLLANLDKYLKENIVEKNIQSDLEKFNYKNVVFVEDDKMIQLIIKKLFERLPETTLHLTGDYSSSMQAILENKPDLLVLDYFLKDCVGTDILEQVFKIKGKLETPILFMTSTPEKVNIESLKDWGNVKGIIQKPIKVKALLNQIVKISK